MSRSNQWFVLGDGIAREVITADIQRYLGPDALVKPGLGTGEHEGRPGYWITAYRTLTSQMIQDLKSDSQRWQQERENRAGRGVAYQDSQTHASRQHWGPSETFAQPTQPARSSQHQSATHYATSGGDHYTTTAPPSTAYAQQPAAYAANPQYTQPRTAQTVVDPYAAYASASRDYPPTQQYPGYPTQPVVQDPYSRQPPPPTHAYPAPSPVAAPGYYIASDGRQYPLSQQPRPSGSRR